MPVFIQSQHRICLCTVSHIKANLIPSSKWIQKTALFSWLAKLGHWYLISAHMEPNLANPICLIYILCIFPTLNSYVVNGFYVTKLKCIYIIECTCLYASIFILVNIYLSLYWKVKQLKFKTNGRGYPFKIAISRILTGQSLNVLV